MRIAINTRFLLKGRLEGFGWYTYEICKRLVQNHPEHEFYFFFDRPYDPDFVFADHVKPIVLGPPARHPVLFYMWYEVAIYRAIKKHRIDLFFSPDGYLSLRSKIPQIGVIHDINFVHFPKDLPRSASRYLNHFFPKFARKAKHLITVSEYSKQDIIQSFGVPEKDVSVIWNSASEKFRPLEENNCRDIRTRYTQGQSYFLFIGSIHPRKNLIRLLQAYTQYRESVLSEPAFDLVIVGENLWKHKGLTWEAPASVKKHIHFTGRLEQEELTRVCAAASGLVYVPYFEGFGIPLVEAMKCGIPIISGNKTALPEVVDDAGILVDPYKVEEITQAMIQLSENEELRTELAKKSLERGKLFSWDQAAKEVWEVISKHLN
ncbi:MAG: glycosyltransferase family 1 protein [Bacteroidetes bacterium]|nr:MAG: glycosyltransferase family 1 protein [Bacteroidota bacterium]